MAQTYKWIATVSTAWDGDGWSGPGGGPTGPPGASNYAIFDGSANGNCTQPSGDEDCLALYVAPAYTGQMGTSSNPLTVDASSGSGTFVLKGSGDMYFQSDVDQCVINKSGNITFENDNVCRNMNIFNGNVTLTPNAQMNFLNIGNNTGGGPTVTLEAGSSTPTTTVLNNGSLTVENSSCPIIYQRGGRVTLSGVTAITNYLCSGGSTTASQNDNLQITGHLVVQNGGSVDLSGCKGTISLDNDAALIVHSGGYLNLDNGQAMVPDSGGLNDLIRFIGGTVKLNATDSTKFIEVG